MWLSLLRDSVAEKWMLSLASSILVITQRQRCVEQAAPVGLWQMSQQAARQIANRPHWDHIARHIKGSDSLMRTKMKTHLWKVAHTHTQTGRYDVIHESQLEFPGKWLHVVSCCDRKIYNMTKKGLSIKPPLIHTQTHTSSFFKFLKVVPCQRSQPWLEQICLPWPTCFSPTGCDQSTLRKTPTSWRTSVISKH